MEIGRQLNLSVRTVENHRSRILKKTRRSSRAELVASARASTASLTSDARYLAAGPALAPRGDALGAGPDGAADGLMAVPRGGRTDRTKGLTQVGTPFAVTACPIVSTSQSTPGERRCLRVVRAARGHVWFRGAVLAGPRAAYDRTVVQGNDRIRACPQQCARRGAEVLKAANEVFAAVCRRRSSAADGAFSCVTLLPEPSRCAGCETWDDRGGAW